MSTAFVLLLRQRSAICRRASTLAHVIDTRLTTELDSIRQAGTWKTERIISTSQSAHIKVERSSSELLNFCANNYLGLSDHKDVVQAAKDALDQYGAGLSSVRFICGTQTIHKQRKVSLGIVQRRRRRRLPLLFSRATDRPVPSTRRRHSLYLVLRRQRGYLRNLAQGTGLCHQCRREENVCEGALRINTLFSP